MFHHVASHACCQPRMPLALAPAPPAMRCSTLPPTLPLLPQHVGSSAPSAHTPSEWPVGTGLHSVFGTAWRTFTSRENTRVRNGLRSGGWRRPAEAPRWPGGPAGASRTAMWPAPSIAMRPIPSRPTRCEPRNRRGSGGPKAPIHRDRDGFIAKTKPCPPPTPPPFKLA